MRSNGDTAKMWRGVAVTAAMLAGVWLVAAQAQEEDGPPPAAIKAAMAAAKGEEKEAQRFPKLEEVIKDMEPIEGLFTLYRYPEGDTKHDPETLLCKIPASMLDQDLLFATSISRGGYFTGWMWTDFLIRWQVAGDNLMLMTPDTAYVQQDDSPVTDAVKRTYNPRYLASAKILTMTPGGDVVIDLGGLLKSNLADVQFMGGAVRSDLSTWHKVKNFPENMLIDVDLALAAGQGGKSVGVSYAFRKLPNLGDYQARAADDRVGYFLTARMDWNRKATARDTFERLIHRWKLEKRDPSLELSPPKQPIVFIIEKTVPIQWRRWVRQGIEEWNKAFEQIGFVDAIVVQQQTDDNEFANYDPEDARYNFFRWIVSGDAFAMGPSRVDPRTGQILDADIIMDDSFIRWQVYEFDMFSPSDVARAKGPGFEKWLEQQPEYVQEGLRRHFPAPVDPQAELRRIAHDKLQSNGHEVCTYADGFKREMALGYAAAISTVSGKEIPERLIGEALREVVIHEVGHTLGLRHNFKASSWLTLDQIRERRDNSDEPTCGSVMDYNPLLFFPGDKADTMRHFVTPAIGPYDYWAIEYGYQAPGDGKSEGDLLKEIASRCTQPGLAYATDEDTMWVFSSDPSTNRFDMGADSVNWAKSRVELCNNLTTNLMDWAVQDGESRYFATRAFNTLWSEKANNFEYLGRVIGGLYFNRDHKGDPGQRPAFVPVTAEMQRDSLGVMMNTLFNEKFFDVDAAVYNELAPSRWSHWGQSMSLRMDFPVHERISMLQWWTLYDICSPPVLQRIYDAELKVADSDKFTAAEYVRTLRDGIFKQLDTPPDGSFNDANPYIGSIARGLQREYLDIMLPLAQATPGMLVSADLGGMVRFALRDLSGKIGGVLDGAKTPDGKSKIDFASLAHLTESKSRMDRILDAQFIGR